MRVVMSARHYCRGYEKSRRYRVKGGVEAVAVSKEGRWWAHDIDNENRDRIVLRQTG